MKALITGAAQGLGLALTRDLLDRGYDVWAVDIDITGLELLAVKMRGACKPVLGDMSNTQSIDRVFRQIEGVEFDLVILNAGISASGKFETIPGAAYKRLIAVNVTAPILMASRLVRDGHMAAKSSMVFVSSLSHATGYPGASVYGASKDAVAVYAKSVRKPFRKLGVRVSCVFPGPLRTGQAARHAPPGAKVEARMPPDKAAHLILKAIKWRKKEIWPGSRTANAKTLGRLFPNTMTRMMRRWIYDKLEENRY